MKVDLYEKFWLWGAGFIILLFITVVVVSSSAYGLNPPSHADTIDPAKVFQDPRFSSIGRPVEGPDGVIDVQMVAMMFAFLPNEVRIPAGRPVRFTMTSTDVTHGFMVAGTNANTMIIPGYISQLTTAFDTPGDYLIICHEFCGNSHHAMFGRIIVEEPK
jgi:cytochrome c oxidase subunit 2